MDIRSKKINLDDINGDFSEVTKGIYPSALLPHIHQPSSKHFTLGFVFYVDGNPAGRYALYQNEHLSFDSEVIITFGSFEALSQELALFIIEHAKKEALKLGGSILIGPMEGSTWSSYRFSKTIQQPQFLTEKIHKEFYLDSFKNSGFKLLANYESRLITFNSSVHVKPHLPEHFSNLNFRKIDLNNLEAELMKIGTFCIEAFSQNFLYSSISQQEFSDQYLDLKNIMNPELIMIAEDDSEEICAIMFAVDDLMSPSSKRAVLKTLARKNGVQYRDLGQYLCELTHYRLHQLGYEGIIHAFMMSTNHSAEKSYDLNSELYREYELLKISL